MSIEYLVSPFRDSDIQNTPADLPVTLMGEVGEGGGN